MALLAINGKISSGKDTVGNLIKDINCENNWEIKKFAGKVKEIASLLTGIPTKKFEDQDFKKKTFKELVKEGYISQDLLNILTKI